MRTTLGNRWFSWRWCMILLAVPQFGYLRAQQTVQRQTVSTVAQVLALAADPHARVRYDEVGKVLQTLPPDELKSLRKQLVVSPHQGLASMAASGLIRDRDATAAGLIASRISTWGQAEQGETLLKMATVRDTFMEIPRELVRSTVKSAQTVQPIDSPGESISIESVSIAAILLAKTGNQIDRQMLLDLASLRPRSWGVWMAIGSAGAMDLTRAKLAGTVYADPKVSIAVRVAAATALEPSDSQAAAFATSQIETFLIRFADHELGSMWAAARGTPLTSDAARQLVDFKTNYHVLSALVLIKTDTAQPLIFRFLNSLNEDIRGLCAIVAAWRWPDQLLKAGQGSFSDLEYADLLAIIALYHPDLAGLAATRITPARMQKAKAHVDIVGVGALGEAGWMMLPF